MLNYASFVAAFHGIIRDGSVVVLLNLAEALDAGYGAAAGARRIASAGEAAHPSS